MIGCYRFGFRHAATLLCVKGGKVLLSGTQANGLLESTWGDGREMALKSALNEQERASFIQQGCCILRQSVNQEMVTRARDFILQKHGREKNGWKSFYETDVRITNLFNRTSVPTIFQIL